MALVSSDKHLVINPAEVDLRKLVSEISMMYSDHMQHHNIKLQTSIEKSVPEMVVTDPIRLK